MGPSAARARSLRRVVQVSALAVLSCVSGCSLLAVTVAPVGLPSPTVTTSPIATSPIATSPTTIATPSASPSPRPSTTVPTPTGIGLPSYSAPAEPACAIPDDVPTSVPGADGPTLTLKQVEKAWRASEAGQNIGVSTGKVEADIRAPDQPAVVLADRGLRWVKLDYFEWASLRTYVLPSPGHAAAKLAAIRSMLREPCSYPFGVLGPYVVVRLSDDSPDALVVTGGMEKAPMMDVFVRHGNTVSHYSVMMMVGPSDDVVSMIRGALTKA